MPLIPSPQGTTRIFVVIGDPVAQVQAPVMLNERFAKAGIDAVMVPAHATALNFAAVIEGLKLIENLDGILITIPHKFTARQHADRVSTVVEVAGSTNALRRDLDGLWSCENFDGLGFVQGLRSAGHDPRGKEIALVGVGGAGVAIAAALLDAGARYLSITDVSAERAAALGAKLNTRWPGLTHVVTAVNPSHAEIAINATPLGLKPEDPLPFDVMNLHASTVVTDIIMKPAVTPLLQAAAARGLAIHQGIHMLTEQIALYEKFFGLKPKYG